MRTLIMGIGNLLMGDEGVGVHVIRHLEKQPLPADVELLDGGSGGLHLLDFFQRFPRVVLIDATLDGRPPGTIERLTPRFSSDYPPTLTAHDIGLKDVLDALFLMDRQPEIVLYTIAIADLNRMAVDLSPDVAAAVPVVAEAVLAGITAET